MLYLGARASLADALPLHIAPRWFSSHSGECRLPGALPRLPLPPWVPGGGGGRGSPGKGELPPAWTLIAIPSPAQTGRCVLELASVSRSREEGAMKGGGFLEGRCFGSEM